LTDEERGENDTAAVVQVEELRAVVLMPPDADECKAEDWETPAWG
jgi:hypothetical protein